MSDTVNEFLQDSGALSITGDSDKMASMDELLKNVNALRVR